MKKVFALVLLLLLVALVSCGAPKGTSVTESQDNSGNEEKLLEKPVTGIDPLWNEPLGYYNISPSAMKVSDTEMYVYYTRNEEIFNDKTDTIAVRKGTKQADGTYSFGEYKTVLKPTGSKDKWDGIYVFAPDVIKGRFTYDGNSYSYLMAYSGSVTSGRMNAQIGLAVSNDPMGDFVRVGENPVIEFNAFDYSPSGLQRYKGAQEPSLVSYDKKGKVQMLYSHYAKYNASYVVEMDCSDLNNIRIGGRMLPDVSGLQDGTTNTHLYSSDWCYDQLNDEYIVCRNFSSVTQGQPAVAEAVQIVYAPSRVLTSIDYTGEEVFWHLINDRFYKIGAIKTTDDYSPDEMKWSGYYRVYNGCMIADQYGNVQNPDKVEILFTSSALSTSKYLTGEQYKFSQMIHYYSVDVEKE